jgi:maleylpyruvate isomerase
LSALSVQRPDPEQDAAEIREATRRLIAAVSALDAGAVAQPSLLPGWTRGHVLTHLARNADSLVNLLTWARTGEETPQYVSAEARDQAIEEGAGRLPAEHLDDLRLSADRLDLAIAELPPAAWASQVRMRSGRVIPAAEIAYARLVEIYFHHVDLGIGYTCDNLPPDFADRALARAIGDLSGHEGVTSVRLLDTGSGEGWVIGAASEPEMTVSGPRTALLAWVSGRADGRGLTTDPALPLPVLPPLV